MAWRRWRRRVPAAAMALNHAAAVLHAEEASPNPLGRLPSRTTTSSDTNDSLSHTY